MNDEPHLLARVANLTGNGIAIADTEGLILWCNRALSELAGFPRERTPGQSLADVIAACGECEGPSPARAVERREPATVLIQRRRAGDDTLWIACDIEPLTGEAAEPARFLATFREVSRQKRAEDRLVEREAMFRALVEQSLVGVFIAQGPHLVYANPRLTRMLGYSARELSEDISVEQLVREDERPKLHQKIAERMAGTPAEESVIYHAVRRDGNEIIIEVLACSARHEGEPALFGMVVDVTERQRHASEVERLAFFDSLTGLPNRRRLMSAAGELLRHAAASDRGMAVMQLDLERFREINDTLGHAVGDELLASVAERLGSAAPADAVTARLGNDQFAVVMPGSRDSDFSAAAHRIIAAIERPHRLGEHQVRVGARAGLAEYPAHGTRLPELLQRADLALNDAKERRSTMECFSPEVERYVRDRVALEKHLIEALDREQLAVHYQPRINLVTGDVAGFEALVRWPHPRLGMIPPDRFIPLAEHTGLIHRLDAWVMEQACQQCRRWRDLGYDVRVSVNLSTRELERDDFVAQVESALQRWGLPPRMLELEVTESTALSGESGIQALRRLRAMGVHLAIDDFGTGYSSLAQLRLLEPTHLKVDKSFVMAIDDAASTESNEARIIEATIQLARSLGIGTVAEGVETGEQLRFVRELGCQEAQGFLFSRPAPAAEIVKMLRRGAFQPGASGAGG
ncbi:EAL domain-containing protein [Ectothiorhodospiraceae bacterium WFHF3C12]|nr:EAL domain-containing protein [Ectothiorhodospiraceae bacterium WFHF3C12]